MNRREFISKAALITAGVTLTGAPAVHTKKRYEWKMVMAWPEDTIVGASGIRLAKLIEKMSNGLITIKVYEADSLVPAFEIFKAVGSDLAEMGHGSPYYWKAEHEACQFFSTVPYGLNSMEMAAWIDYGGGQQLWDELYSQFNLKPFAAGNSGVQMGGWFNKEIRTIDDFSGLKMRMPGLGGDVLTMLGAKIVNLPATKIFDALRSGAIDATEWVSPFEDLRLGLYKVAKYYYWPGWHEPGTVFECFINKKTYSSLPNYLKEIIKSAAHANYRDTLSQYTAKNASALMKLISEHNVQLKRFPDLVLAELGKQSKKIVREVAARDAFTQKVYDSFNAFRKQSVTWDQISEGGYSQSRSFILDY